MSGERSETTYRFAPHPSAGFILGLRIAAARWPDRRRRARAGVAAGRRIRRARAGDRAGGTGGERGDRSGQRPDPRSVDAGHGPVSDAVGARRAFARRPRWSVTSSALPSGQLDPQPVAPPHDRPAELADLELLECQLSAYDQALLGVAKDRRAGTYTAALRVQCRAFEMLSPEERQQRLEEYGGVLAALARDDSPLRRISWVERALPGRSGRAGRLSPGRQARGRVAGGPAV